MYSSRVKRRTDSISVEEMGKALAEWFRQGVGPITHQESTSSFWRHRFTAECDEKIYAWDRDHLTVFTPRHQIKAPIRSWWKWIATWIGAWVLIFIGTPMLAVLLESFIPIRIDVESPLVSFWAMILLLLPLIFLVVTPIYKHFGGISHYHALKVDDYGFTPHVGVAVQLMNEDDLLLFTQAVVAAAAHPAANDAAVKLVNKYAPKVEARRRIQREKIAAKQTAAAEQRQRMREEAERARVQGQVEKELNERRWQAINDGLG